jgi:hypothetical protein
MAAALAEAVLAAAGVMAAPIAALIGPTDAPVALPAAAVPFAEATAAVATVVLAVVEVAVVGEVRVTTAAGRTWRLSREV